MRVGRRVYTYMQWCPAIFEYRETSLSLNIIRGWGRRGRGTEKVVLVGHFLTRGDQYRRLLVTCLLLTLNGEKRPFDHSY